MARTSFIEGFMKAASHAAELAGLGMLAAPSAAELSGHKVNSATKSKIELAGLGTLAAPSAMAVGKKLIGKLKPAVSAIARGH